jgi:release factor glutamine methyltransferase
VPSLRHSDTFNPAAYANFVIEGIAAKLERAGRDEGKTKALWLINHVTGVSFGEILTRGIKPLIKEQWDALGKFLDRVIAGEPIQYVVGNTDFRGRIFLCDRRALVPRPETEELVGLAGEVIAREFGGFAQIVDVGTGTGCIAVSLAVDFPNSNVTATDLYSDALALAQENAHANAAKLEFRDTDLLAGFEPQSMDLVVSNPPYIGTVERAMLAEEVLEHEPHSALFAGEDGLEIIRRLVPQAFEVLRAKGWLLLEIGETQGSAVSQVLTQAGFAGVELLKDLSNRDRFVRGQRL